MSPASSSTGRGRTNSSPPELSSGSLIEELRLAREELLKDTLLITVESTISKIAGRERIRVRPTDLVKKLVLDFLDKHNVDQDNTYILRDSQGVILQSSKTIADSGLGNGDLVYLSSLDSVQHPPFSYANWWRVAALCLFFALSVSSGSLGAFFLLNSTSHLYGIVIDAGSVHTAVYSYRYSGERVGGTGVLVESHFCEMEQAGIASFVREPRAAVSYINSSCLRESIARIPEEARNKSMLILGSTAGMRVLAMQQPTVAHQILGNLSEALPALGGGMKTNVEVFPGNLEGQMGWVTVNFLMKFFTTTSSSSSNNNNSSMSSSGPVQSCGALDWGGASSQITHQMAGATDSVSLSLYGQNYSLYVKSSLCYGQKEALMRYRASLVHSAYLANNRSIASILRLTDPCAPQGSLVRTTISHQFGYLCSKTKDPEFMAAVTSSNGILEFEGRPDLPTCQRLVSTLFNYSMCSAMYASPSGEDTCLDPASFGPPPVRNYFAFSTFWYLVSGLGLPSSHSLRTLSTKVEQLCNLPRSRLLEEGLEKVSDSACFKLLFMKQLLLTGYHFDQDSYQRIQFVRRMESAAVGWSLGYMILRSDDFEDQKTTIYLSRHMFVVLLALSGGFLLLAVFFAYQARVVSSATSRKYERLETSCGGQGA